MADDQIVYFVEFIDGEPPREMRGVEDARCEEGLLIFEFDSEVVTYPVHRIKSIVSTIENDGAEQANG